MDIAKFSMKHNVPDHEKYRFVSNHFTPDLQYKFKKNSIGRSFQHQWLVRYPWLKYSEQVNGGYCLPCVMFGRTVGFRADPGVLVSSPLLNFKKALEILEKHMGKDYHKEAVVKMDTFVRVMSGSQDNISVQLSNVAKDLVSTNRKKLQSIIETIILCGRQNIPLRGTYDTTLDLERHACVNHGNFWALLQFRVSAGDLALKEHLATAPKNATYTSPDIQNQVIDIIGDHILEKILSKVKRAQFFTLIADEVTDRSNKEQLGLALRYVNPEDSSIREDLVSFLECDGGISGQALAEMMVDFLRKHGLDPTKLRGQAYDGAGNMSGKTNGAAARITSQFPLALYIHCASHSLNLAVVSSLEEVSVRNMISIVKRVSIFFSAHPKRQKKLEEAIENTQPELNVCKLKDCAYS